MGVINGALRPKPCGRNWSAALPSVTLMPRVPGSMRYEPDEASRTRPKSSAATPMSLGRNDWFLASLGRGAGPGGGRGVRGGSGIGLLLAESFEVLELENDNPMPLPPDRKSTRL